MTQQVTRQLILFLLICSAIIRFTCANSEPWYQVEIIIFKHDTQGTTPAGNILATTETDQQPIELIANYEDGVAYSLLSTSQLQLKKELSNLLRSNNYQILTHIGWRQPISNSNHPRPVHFIGNELPTPEEHSLRQLHAWQINGLFWVRKINESFNIKMNILFSPNKNIDDETLMLNTIQLVQQQRVRSNELLYFDHPYFGVLVKLTPYTIKPNTISNDNDKQSRRSSSEEDDWEL